MGKKDRICVRAREQARAHTQTKTNRSHKDMQADKCFNYVRSRGTRRGRVWLVKHLNIT